MASWTPPIRSPFAPLDRVANLYLDQTLMQLEVNTMTQRIYPTEVYRGYKKVNEYRRQHGMWFSTGEGAKSFTGKIYQADDQQGLLTVGISFNDYLRYVDLGVGLTGNPKVPAAHITADKVDRNRPARYKSKYIRGGWNRRQGRSHRPAIMMEIRHLKTRYERHLADFYGYQGAMQIITALEGFGEHATSPSR